MRDNAEPSAQAVADQALRPAGKAVAKNAEPAAKQVTDGALRPAGKAVADNAVPMTKSVMRDQARIFTRGSTKSHNANAHDYVQIAMLQ